MHKLDLGMHIGLHLVLFGKIGVTRALRWICKKLALRGDERPTNLHAAERRLDLPRRTCTITDDNGDTIFVNEVQPKPTSPGHDYGRSSPTATPVAPGFQQYAAFPLRAYRYVIMVTTVPPLSYL
jgi:hypothetical protein